MSLGLIGENIPSSWIPVNLTELVTPKQWKTISTKQLLDKGYVVYGANGQIGFYSEYTHENPTLMITCRGATCGNVHISVPFSYINGNAMALDNQQVHLIGLNFLRYAIEARGLQDIISGSAQPQITGQNLSKAQLPFPPLAEQQQIAEILDRLLAEVTNAKAELEAALVSLKQFRQSVLAAAVSGELCSDSQPTNKFRKLGQAGIEVKTGPFGSALHKSDYIEGGIPVVNPMHINDGQIQTSSFMTISKEKFGELSAWHLKKGDVIVGRRGEMGRAAMIIDDAPLLCGTGSMILRTPPDALPEFLALIIRSPRAINYFNSASVGSTMVNLNQQIIKNLEVYFPPLAEQKQIVTTVQSLFTAADIAEQETQAALERVNNLTQSILAKAFRGELTAKWREETLRDNPELITGENSAKSLLAKIKAEREAKALADKEAKKKTTRKKVATS